MTNRIFVDSNIWLYLFLKDSEDLKDGLKVKETIIQNIFKK